MTEVDDAEKRAAERVKDFKAATADALVAIYAGESEAPDTIPILIGSGVLVLAHGIHFVVTASHVLREARMYPHVHHSLRGAGRTFAIGDLAADDAAPLDVAVIQLSAIAARVASRLVPVTPSDFDVEASSRSRFFFHGFPAKRSYGSTLLGGTTAESLPLEAPRYAEPLARLTPEQNTRLTPIRWDIDGLFDERGEARSLSITPDGLSGAGVWSVDEFSGRGQTKRFAGILTNWKTGDTCLLACQAQFVAALLLSGLRHKDAYYRYEERAARRSAGDTLTDWLASEAKYRTLVA